MAALPNISTHKSTLCVGGPSTPSFYEPDQMLQKL